MASDASVTHMIFFIAAVVVAASMAGVFISVGYEMAQKIDVESEAMTEAMQSEIAIINDPAMVPYDGTSLTIYVENTGSSTLTTQGLFVMMDGSYTNDTALQVLGSERSAMGAFGGAADHDQHFTGPGGSRRKGDHGGRRGGQPDVPHLKRFRA